MKRIIKKFIIVIFCVSLTLIIISRLYVPRRMTQEHTNNENQKYKSAICEFIEYYLLNVN